LRAIHNLARYEDIGQPEVSILAPLLVAPRQEYYNCMVMASHIADRIIEYRILEPVIG
jgi:hypothetical protein